MRGEPDGIACEDPDRLDAVASRDDLHGIHGVEVLEGPTGRPQRRLRLHFVPEDDEPGRASLASLIEHLAASPRRVRITSEPGLPEVRVTGLEAGGDHLDVHVDRPGGHAPYTLEASTGEDPPARLDPRLSRVRFSFKAGCPTPVDCDPPDRPRPPDPPEEPVDYLAKDYASFRKLLEDLAQRRLPGGYERNPAALTTTLIELMAHAGDHLSYYQDAVANEPYLETARRRTSVRRHARLIDYRMHDGASARAFVVVAPQAEGRLPRGTQFVTRLTEPLRSNAPSPGPVIPAENAERAARAADAVFETMHDADVHPDLADLDIHRWGNEDCRLPEGAVTADLVPADEDSDADLAELISPGDLLLLEEVRGRETGREADRDPTRRHVVRVREVERLDDPLRDGDVTRVHWDREDALPFDLHVSSDVEVGGERAEDVVLAKARGNVLVADHGRTITEWHPGGARWTPPDSAVSDPPDAGIETGRRPYRFEPDQGPLSFRIPLPEDGRPPAASRLRETDPGTAVPGVQAVRARSGDGEPLGTWTPVTGTSGSSPSDTRGHDLLESGPFDRDVVVEIDDRGRAQIRFGDDTHGEAPPDGARLLVTYRVGAGPRGNVGTGTLQHVVEPVWDEPPFRHRGDEAPGPDDWPWTTAEPGGGGADRVVRNPLPAWGGTEPEPVERVKRLAPQKIDEEPLRAVTESDYREVAERHPDVDRAAAAFRWTGSWHTILVAVDPVGRSDLPPAMEPDVQAWVRRFAQADTDVEVRQPEYRPLEIRVEATPGRGSLPGDVHRGIVDTLSNRELAGGSRGLFHPDNWTFGDTVYLSQVYAAIESVDGVHDAEVTVFRPLGEPGATTLEDGRVTTGPFQVARLDNDPDRPRNGVLEVEVTSPA